MDYKKIDRDLNKLFEINDDLIKLINQHGDFVKNSNNHVTSKSLMKLMNYLCRSSKRVFVKTGESWDKFRNNTRNGDKSLGLNSKGIGIMSSWGSQLVVLGSSRDYRDNSKRIYRFILSDKETFNALIKVVNKNSVKDLRKLRNFYKKYGHKLNEEFDEFNTLKIPAEKVGKSIFRIRFDCNDGEVNHVDFYNEQTGYGWDYRYNHLPKIINNPSNIHSKEKISELIPICDKLIDLNFKDLKMMIYLFNKKKEMKQQIKERQKSITKGIKLIKKENEFLDKMLKPILAVENL